MTSESVVPERPDNTNLEKPTNEHQDLANKQKYAIYHKKKTGMEKKTIPHFTPKIRTAVVNATAGARLEKRLHVVIPVAGVNIATDIAALASVRRNCNVSLSPNVTLLEPERKKRGRNNARWCPEELFGQYRKKQLSLPVSTPLGNPGPCGISSYIRSPFRSIGISQTAPRNSLNEDLD